MSAEHDSRSEQDRSARAMPLGVYLGVWGALIVLTAVAVQIHLLDLGPHAIYALLAVAALEAALVVAFFMRLKDEAGLNRLLFLSSLLLLLLLFSLTLIDLGSRADVQEAQGNFALIEDRAAEKKSP